LVQMAMEPLVRIADLGIPVYLVPGNHERSRFPLRLWSVHPHLHIFDVSKTYMFQKEDVRLALVGFPFVRKIRDRFNDQISQTGYEKMEADVYLLCMHQTVEGAQVGPSDYTFSVGPGVVRSRDIPEGFSAVLCGHIHRAQVLNSDLSGKPLRAPVIYPGSIERTSFAERKESKKFVLLKVAPDARPSEKPVDVMFIPLPTRPMEVLTIDEGCESVAALDRCVRRKLNQLDSNAVVRIQVPDSMPLEMSKVLNAKYLRTLAPSTMNISVSYPRIIDSERSDKE
jgi:DNA repair exonuclease SbcCD nuclease subunit